MTASQQKVATYTGDKQWDRKARKTATVSVHWVADTPTQQSPVDLRMDCSNHCRSRLTLPEAQLGNTLRSAGNQPSEETEEQTSAPPPRRRGAQGAYGIEKQGSLRLDGWGVQGDVMGKSWDNLTP